MKERFDALITRTSDWSAPFTPFTIQQPDRMKQKVTAGLAARDFKLVLHTFDRNFGVSVFGLLSSELTDEEYWPLLADVWSGIEWPGRQIRTLARFLRSNRPKRELMTAPADREALAAMPDPITIFRGVPPYGRAGWSWTVDQDQADWFALRPFNRPGGTVIEAAIAKQNVIAYLMRRTEARKRSLLIRGTSSFAAAAQPFAKRS